MLKHIIITALLIISNAFGAGSSHGGSWIEDWLYPDTGLFFLGSNNILYSFCYFEMESVGPINGSARC